MSAMSPRGPFCSLTTVQCSFHYIVTIVNLYVFDDSRKKSSSADAVPFDTQ